MQVTIRVLHPQLEELANFLKSDIPYEHNIQYRLNGTSGVEVQVFYDDFVKLEDWKITKTKSRTNDSGSL